jgi:tRNA (cytidine/uridine-2'-O-)-methyltransferase
VAELNIVLYEPEIPANTGNIGRTCVATGTKLHLIEPLGFRLDEKALKRAGMDYWKDLDVTTYVNWDDFCEKNPNAKIYMATTKGRHVYSDVSYEPDCFIMFGKESAGIPEEILKANPAAHQGRYDLMLSGWIPHCLLRPGGYIHERAVLL